VGSNARQDVSCPDFSGIYVITFIGVLQPLMFCLNEERNQVSWDDLHIVDPKHAGKLWGAGMVHDFGG